MGYKDFKVGQVYTIQTAFMSITGVIRENSGYDKKLTIIPGEIILLGAEENNLEPVEISYSDITNFKVTRNLTFLIAFNLMKQGYKIKLPEWNTYLLWHKNTVCLLKDNSYVDIKDILMTEKIIRSISRKDWRLFIEGGENIDSNY